MLETFGPSLHIPMLWFTVGGSEESLYHLSLSLLEFQYRSEIHCYLLKLT